MSPLFANPSGPSVAAGSASFATSGNALTITNTPGAIINWQQFSIQKDEVTRFIQQNAASAVLNRVTSQNPSVILGQLLSNGRVFLINPSGIAFGQGAVVNVAGLTASTLNISDADFLSGRLRFVGGGTEGKVANAGTIETAQGGQVYLIAPNVENQASGVITSPKGEVVIAAGNSVELVNAGTADIRVQFTAPANAAVNAGEVLAASGSVGIYGTLIKNSGRVSATRAEIGDGGTIVFKATKDVTLEAGSRLEANGVGGGSITVQAEGGTLLASGSVEAVGELGKGGEIRLLGERVGLIGNATADASGQTGGGTVLVGGDRHGDNPDVQNAWRTYFGADASVKADAIQSGDGGKVIVWSDDVTRFYGSISARGGSQSGNGGFAEVSSKNLLNFYGKADVSAPSGLAGTILLDPTDITIQDATPAPSDAQVSSGSVLFADGGSTNFTISDEALEALSGNVVLQATRDITVNAGLSGGLTFVNQTGGERVVFQSGRHITINSPVSTNGAALWLEADSPHSNGGTTGADGAGAVRINATVQSFLSDPTTGGKITLIAGTNTNGGTNGGGFTLNADVDAGAGGIDIALSQQSTGTLSFFIGSAGQAQFTSTDTGALKSTGQLKIGEATTAGTDGLGTSQITIKVDSLGIGTTAGGPVSLAASAGTSLVLTSGSGGITVDRPLSINQTALIDTTGALTITQPITTNGSNLTVQAASVSGTSLINTGGGTFNCTGNGCTTTKTWDGGAGTLSWFDAVNWSGDTLPTNLDDVTIAGASGTVLVSGLAASAHSLIANSPLQVSSSGSLSLVSGSQFTQNFILSSGGSLLGAGTAAVSGPSGVLTWSGGAMGSGGNFVISGGRSGTLFGSLTLDRLFQNSGTITLGSGVTGATVSGLGSILNSGTIIAASGTSNTVSVPLTNPNTLQLLGSLIATSFPLNSGTINIASGGALVTSNASLTNDAAGVIDVASGGSFDLGTGSFSNSGVATFGGSYNIGTTNVSGGTVAFNGPASTGTLNLSGGTVNGTGDLTVSTNYNETGGTLGTTFANLSLTKAGDFTVGSFAATSSLALTASGGALIDGNGALANVTAPSASLVAATGISLDTAVSTLTTSNTASGNTSVRNSGALAVGAGGMSNSGGGSILLTNDSSITLNGAVAALGASGDAVVLAGTSFVNAAGSSAINPGSGRWLVYSTNPAGDTFGGLTSGNKAIWGRSYPVAVAELGNRYVFSDTGAVIVTTTDAAKSYGAAPLDLSSNYTLSGGPVDAATHGNVYVNATLADIFASGPTISSVGNTTAAHVGAGSGAGGAYPITGSGTANTSFSLTFADNGLLTVNTAPLTVTANNQAKTYGNLFTFTGSEFTPTGLKNGDTVGSVTLTSAGAPVTAHVAGSPYAIVASAATGGSFAATDYNVSYVNGLLTVNTAPLTVTANNQAKTYGNLFTFTGSEFTPTGLKNGDTVGSVTLTSAGAPVTAHVAGSPYAIVASAATGGSFAATDYNVSYVNGQLTVNPFVLSLAGTRIYDSTTSFASTAFGSSGTISTGVNGETLALSGTGSVPLKSVAAGTQALTLGTLALNNGTGAAGDYTLLGGTHTGTITLATLTGSITAANKSYDATTTATITNRALSGVLGGDAVSYTGGTANFSDKNVGTAKTVSATGLSLTGADAGNYTVNTSAATTANITAAPLTVTAQADSRGYNGTTSSVVAPVLTGTLYDAVGTPATQSYDTKNAGTLKTLTASGLVVTDGNGGANYAVSYVTNGNGTITQAPLTVTAQADSRGYNGTTGSAVAPVLTGTLYDAVGTAATQSYDTKNVGTLKTLTASGLMVTDGNGGANYAVSYVTNTNGTITAAPIFLAGSKPQDGNTTFLNTTFGTSGTISGVNGETLGLTGSGSVASPNTTAGTQPLSLDTLVLANGSGLTSNYILSGGTGTITAATSLPQETINPIVTPITTTTTNVFVILNTTFVSTQTTRDRRSDVVVTISCK